MAVLRRGLSVGGFSSGVFLFAVEQSTAIGITPEETEVFNEFLIF
jgi:hypothetical protein